MKHIYFKIFQLSPSLMAVKGVPSSSCKRITFRATSFPFTLVKTQCMVQIFLLSYPGVTPSDWSN